VAVVADTKHRLPDYMATQSMHLTLRDLGIASDDHAGVLLACAWRLAAKVERSREQWADGTTRGLTVQFSAGYFHVEVTARITGWPDQDAVSTEDTEPTSERCPAAHPEDPSPCGGPAVVTVLDAQNHGADGCEHHAARTLASLERVRVYNLHDAPVGTAVRVYRLAQQLQPFPWRGEDR
jgi:hypothetical protein